MLWKTRQMMTQICLWPMLEVDLCMCQCVCVQRSMVELLYTSVKETASFIELYFIRSKPSLSQWISLHLDLNILQWNETTYLFHKLRGSLTFWSFIACSNSTNGRFVARLTVSAGHVNLPLWVWCQFAVIQNNPGDYFELWHHTLHIWIKQSRHCWC